VAFDELTHFSPFGEPFGNVGDSEPDPRYTDHEYDHESGFNYMKGRYSLPGHGGKFNRPDPMRDWDWENPHSINLYQYVRNNPVMSYDPTGRIDYLAAAKQSFESGYVFLAGAINSWSSNNMLGAGRQNPSDLPAEHQFAARAGQTFGDFVSIGQSMWEAGTGITLVAGSIVASPFAVAAGGPTMGGSVAVDGGALVLGSALTIHAATVFNTAVSNSADNLMALSEGSGSGGTNIGGKVEGKTSNNGQNDRIKIDERRSKHIFRDKEGHFRKDTSENRAILEDVANDPSAELGTDIHGKTWYQRTRSDGTQIWVNVRNGKIEGGGLNETARTFNPETGLSAEQIPNRQ